MLNNIGEINSSNKTDKFGQALENSTPKDNTNLKHFTYSWHSKVIAELTKEEGGKITRGWELVSTPWEEEQITGMLRSRSYLPSELRDGYKVKSNVKNVYAYALDFDKGSPSIEG